MLDCSFPRGSMWADSLSILASGDNVSSVDSVYARKKVVCGRSTGRLTSCVRLEWAEALHFTTVELTMMVPSVFTSKRV